MRKKIYRFVALFTAINLLTEIFFPAVSYALTSGPSQPEHVQFAPVGANNSVDLFSGDFSYNIPLFELPGPDGGYPFNLTYQAGVGVEEEASWVGLGWNLTPGAINRQMRGLPDEFKGDVIEQKIERRPNKTLSFGAGANIGLVSELFGFELDKVKLLEKVNISGGASLSIRYNNYTGMGYAFTPSFSYGMDLAKLNLKSIGVRTSIGRSHSVTGDTESGATTSNNTNINFSLSSTKEDAKNTMVNSHINMGLGYTYGNQYNSRQGLLSESHYLSTSLTKVKNFEGKGIYSSGNTWSSLDYTNNGYMPSISIPNLVGTSSFLAKTGIPFKGTFTGNWHLSGSITSQEIRYDDKDKKTIDNRAYGYNHSEEKKGLMDINRERDKIIDKETKTLPTPNFTYDTYMVTGQGLTGMFRPYRGEVGVLGDNYAKSNTISSSMGVDLGIPKSIDNHFGVNLEIITGTSTSHRDTEIGKYSFRGKEKGSLHEPLYYKFQGEASIKPINSLEKIGNHIPVRFELNDDGTVQGDNITYSQVEADISNDNSSISGLTTATETNTVVTTKTATLDPYFNQGRDSRNTLIQEVTNEQADYLPEYNIKYKEGAVENQTLFRTKQDTLKELTKHLKPHHLAGFTCLNAGGSRYIYGLPAYNYEQFEVVRSTENSGNDSHRSKLGSVGSLGGDTEKYNSRTKTPAYPYAYLLTSILGTDYIDVDGSGISKNDLGYWVKFGYQRVHNDYDWRSPYTGVNFTEGLHNTDMDDKASYAFGKKDIFYVQKVETKSHIAVFYTSDREDAKSSSLTNTDDDDIEKTNGTGSIGSQRLKKLDKIALFTRAEYEKEDGVKKPIKEIHFQYELPNVANSDYELCKGTPNGAANAGNGKLTLKRIWFTYQGVNRGQLSPYEFEYYNADYPKQEPIPTHNQDRWGVFAPRDMEIKHKTHASFPYVDQTLTETQRNQNVSAWNLKEIKMPTGSRMKISYESDDYAYVQDKKAMQMYSFSMESGTPFTPYVEGGDFKEIIEDTQLKVFFELQENDISEASQEKLTDQQAAEIVNRYLDGREQIYVKTVISLRGNKDFEDISAYLDIAPNKSGEDTYTRGITMANKKYYGYVTLLPAKDTEGNEYHPLTVAAWIKLKTEHPRLILPKNKMEENQDFPGWKDIAKFVSAFKALRERKSNYYDIANDSDWGRKLLQKYSYVRLNNTKGHKYGGGYRVKSVEFWDGTGAAYSSQSTYGQVYEYTTQEDGKTISSGVASYEPLTGGDENALRYAEKYIKDIPGKSKHAMGLTGYEFYVEYPVNEGYYPGAKVGYSKVTVKSLATAKKIEQINEFKNISTTGLTVNEFYTTKDFPTLAAQTDVDHQESEKPMRALFPFYVKHTQNAGMSQGFVVEVNNMDGKPKAMYHYGQNDKGEVLYDKPISSSEYFYKTKQRGKHQVLDNACQVLVEEKDGIIKKEERLVGVDYDVFIDSRTSKTRTTRGGGNYNTTILFIELLGVTIPIPSLFVSASTQVENINITTINKVIYRSGILDYVKVSDGLSTSTTQNLLWDANTGGVLLTSVNNNFDDKIYSYTIPAYTQYDEMGAAYRNIGLEFDLVGARYADGGRMYNLEAPIPKSKEEKDWKHELWTDELVPGDELIVDCGEIHGLRKAIYMGADRTTQRFRFFVLDPLPADFVGTVECTVMRSGRRNLLAASAGNITSLQDPTENRTHKTFSGKSTITKEK